MSDLIPCRACQRHVASNEASCPFCGAHSPARPCTGCSGPTAARLAQAALVAAGAAALLGASCSSNSAVVPYGVPPHQDASVDSPQDAGAPTDGSPDTDDAK